MKFLLIIAAAGAVSVSGPRTTLDAELARSLGIGLEVRNVAYELRDEPSPLFLNLNLEKFDACIVRGVGMDVRDENATLIFGVDLASFRGPYYHFRLDRRFLDTTMMGIVCDDGPDVLSHVHLFTLSDLVSPLAR